MSSTLRSILLFVGLLVLVLIASLFYAGKFRDEAGGTGAEFVPAAATGSAPVAPEDLHPELIAGREALADRRFDDAIARFSAVPVGDPSYLLALYDMAGAQRSSGDLEASITGTGMAVGTPAYMSPEQIEGKRVGPAADIYAMGVVIFEMLTGTWPFTGTTPFSIAAKRLNEKPISPRKVALKVREMLGNREADRADRDPRR